MGTTTLKELMQNFSEQIGDYLTFATTDNIGAGTTVVSTDLQQYDGSGDDSLGIGGFILTARTTPVC